VYCLPAVLADARRPFTVLACFARRCPPILCVDEPRLASACFVPGRCPSIFCVPKPDRVRTVRHTLALVTAVCLGACSRVVSAYRRKARALSLSLSQYTVCTRQSGTSSRRPIRRTLIHITHQPGVRRANSLRKTLKIDLWGHPNLTALLLPEATPLPTLLSGSPPLGP
jgi:hypothetical protein